MKKIMIAAGLLVAAGSAQAAMIASDSFVTIGSNAGGYTSGTSLSGQAPIVENSGFTAARTWIGSEGQLNGLNWMSLTHSGITGSTATGSIRISGGGYDFDQASYRQLGTTPMVASSSYYMSGLVRGYTYTDMEDGEYRSVGFGAAPDTTSISEGMHYGLRKEGGTVYLSAFAGGNTYDLTTVTSGSTVYQVVLRLDVNAAGNDTFSAGYAVNGAADLTMGATGVSLETWGSSADMEYLRLQRKTGGGFGVANKEIVFDEVRFGTTLGDVTTYDAIPEPATLGLVAAFGGAILFIRRKFMI